MAPEVENGELDAHSWVALAIFLVAVVFVIRPVKIALKFGLTLHLNLATVPPLGILILLCSQTIDWATIRDGILGTNVGVKPYAIMLLFYSLASWVGGGRRRRFLIDYSNKYRRISAYHLI